MQTILKADTVQIFADWGQPAVLEEVQAYYDPETAQMEESVVTTALNVLVGATQSELSKSTAALNPQQEILFVIQNDELPLNVNLNSARLIFNGTAFKVEAMTQSHIPATLALNCVVHGE